MSAPFVERRARVVLGGVQTTVHDFGVPGAAPVIALHSAGLDGSTWRAFARVAAEIAPVRILAPDLRGHGDSQATSDMISLEAMVTDVIELRQTLGSGPVSLLGTSLGGVIAGLAAAATPDIWNKVVIACAPDRGYPAFRDRAAQALRDGMGSLVNDTLDRWFTPSAINDDLDCVRHARASLECMQPERWAAVWSSFADFAGFTPVRNAACIAGSEDQSTPPATMVRVRTALVVAGPVHELARAPHQLYLERAADAAALWWRIPGV